MNAYELRAAYRSRHPDWHYFDDDTLKIFGERMSEMRVLKNIVTVKDVYGNEHRAYVLSSLQRNCPSGPQRHYTYFDVDTIEDFIAE
mgnify:CR=1 FL=1